MRVVTALVIAAALAAAAACGGSPTSPSAGGSSSLSIMLKDSPYSDAKSLLVTFSDVSVHRSDQADDTWTKVAFSGSATTRTCDLKKLQDAQDILGVGSLAAGHYTQIRVTVTSATLYFENAAGGGACATTIAAPTGRSASVDVPSGEVKLNREFDVKDGAGTTMVLDFDGDRSVHDTGSGRFLMSPVISVASVQ
jgi:hypothetical protein